MGFFSSFFKKITQPTLDSSNLVEPPSDISNLKQSASVNPNLRNYIYDPDMFDFEDEHEKDIEKWNRRIDNAEPSSGDNPDKKVAAYEKAIELCNEFESFCSDFPGGTIYYLENEQSRRDELERDLEDYLSEDYEEEKSFYEEEKAKKKLFSTTKSKIMKFVSSKECGVMRKEIYAQFPPELQPIVLKGLNALISDGKIYKLKQNDRLLFIAAK